MIKRVRNSKVVTQHSTGCTYKLHSLMKAMATHTCLQNHNLSKKQVYPLARI